MLVRSSLCIWNLITLPLHPPTETEHDSPRHQKSRQVPVVCSWQSGIPHEATQESKKGSLSHALLGDLQLILLRWGWSTNSTEYGATRDLTTAESQSTQPGVLIWSPYKTDAYAHLREAPTTARLSIQANRHPLHHH